MRLWLYLVTGISKTARKVLCIDPFGEPEQFPYSLLNNSYLDYVAVFLSAWNTEYAYYHDVKFITCHPIVYLQQADTLLFLCLIREYPFALIKRGYIVNRLLVSMSRGSLPSSADSIVTYYQFPIYRKIKRYRRFAPALEFPKERIQDSRTNGARNLKRWLWAIC